LKKRLKEMQDEMLAIYNRRKPVGKKFRQKPNYNQNDFIPWRRGAAL